MKAGHFSAKIPGQLSAEINTQVTSLIKLLSGFTARATPESGDKVTRFSPFSAQAEAGNVLVLRGPWNDEWFTALEGFPEAKHDDDADSTSRAFNALAEAPEPFQWYVGGKMHE